MRTEICYWIGALTIGSGAVAFVRAASTVQFSTANYAVFESAGFAAISVQRLDDLGTGVTVIYSTADLTATNGVNYESVSGTLAFGGGETNKTILVPILNDGLVEGNKTFQVILNNPSSGAVLGARTTATVRITDNDIGVQFQLATYSVIEDAGVVMLGVVRGDDGTLPVSVDFFTTNLAAKNEIDFSGITNTLSFAPEERLKQVSVRILNNARKEPSRDFRVTLANPAGATLGAQMTATVTILDNDQGFQFATNSYSVPEDAGVVRIGVLRGTDDTNSTATVDFATSDMTATNGTDYTGLTNTLSFAPGDRLKWVSVSILNDGLKEPTKQFRVTLRNASNGAVLGAPTTAVVSILDNDPGVGFELSSYSVMENAGSITVTVLRGNDVGLGPISADYATTDITAKAGRDYQALSGTLSFEQNETVKAVNVPILHNGLVTNNTSFRVTLRNPTGGANLGTASTVVMILEAGQFAARTVAPPFDSNLTIERDGTFNTLNWSGGGQLQRADSPAGPWQIVTTATNPATIQSPLTTTFYRVTLPRPANVYIPSSYDGKTLTPLVINLPYFRGTGDDAENFWHLLPLAEARGFLYCHPDGTIDRTGNPFLNATDSCCDFFSTGIDDAGYLRALIEEIARQFAVDRKRIHLIGVSNGAFMAYRMACESADLIAGIASNSGVTFLDPSRCRPSQPVNILHIHGTADTSVPYGGGSNNTLVPPSPANMPAFPGALQTVQIWADYNGARDPVTDSARSLDLTLDVPGLDTVITRYTNFPAGGAVELWTVIGAGHGLNQTPQLSPRVIDWLLAHPKP